MRSELIRDIELAGRSVNWRALKIASAALALIGTAGFLFGVLGGEAKRAWQAYLINFVFWTGVSTGAFLLSPIMVITNAHWGRSLKRLAEAAGAFIPVAFVMFWFLFLGREEVFPWLHEHLHVRAKEIWLQVPFLFLRDGAGLLILAGLFVLITYHSVEADIEYLRGHHGGRDRHLRYQSNFAPVYAVAFAFILTLLSFDLIMSLDPHWISTLFGAYYFAGSFYTGIAAVILLSAFAVKQMGMGKYISGKSFHDLGKLLFGFCIVSADFFYVQFLVIWYGNLPEETRYVLARVRFDPWTALAWTVLLLCYVLPFLILLFRKVKMTVWSIAAMSVWVLAAMWLERFFLVAPSVWKAPTLPLGLTELLVSVGYLGI
ncbi:MAG: NrfD/PsrC family molybdoenzyme membrane anchor subunit, partial [Syntrophobacteraceae bacterium]